MTHYNTVCHYFLFKHQVGRSEGGILVDEVDGGLVDEGNSFV